MAYQERSTPPELAEYVEFFWSFVGPGGEIDRIVPDGRCELLVHLRTSYLERAPDGDWQMQPRVLFAGQLTRPLWLTSNGPVAVVSARIRPESAGAVAGRPASELTDQRVSLERIDPVASERIVRALERAATLDDASAAFADILTARLRATAIDPRVREIVQEIDRRTNVSIKEQAQFHGISVRQVERLFATHVGIPPRLYMRIRRFRQVFDVLNDHRGAWATAAAEAGYADQPELAHDFRRFVGCTAREFHATRSDLSAELTRMQPMSQ